MFKHKAINFRWPAVMSGFKTDSANENFSRGKLKVFYKGETADKRLFSDKFADELVKSLPYTPVVGHYDTEKKDFVGHASEQNIYGMVDPCVEPEFIKDENDVEWCVCDVVLYTERPDTTGEIAQKIVGHKQSLELDRRTVKYVINYDERKHFKNLEFTAGTFVGVSVLGDDEEPAFTGSAFFEKNEQFEQKMEILRNYCEGNSNPNKGEEPMNLDEFLKLSWGDICTKVSNAVKAEYGNEYYTYDVDFFDDSGIYRFYSYLDGSIKLMRVFYSVTETGDVTLNKIVETHVVYEDVEDTVQTGTFSNQSGDSTDFSAHGDDSDENFTLNNGTTVTELSNDGGNTEVTPEPTPAPSSDIQPEENAEVAPITKVSAVNENQVSEEAPGTASFTDSERAELEALKKEKKLSLITSYKEHLSDEQYEEFVNNVDNVEFSELETQLLRIYKEKKDAENENDFVAQPVPFAVPEPQKPETADSKLNSYIRKMLRR